MLVTQLVSYAKHGSASVPQAFTHLNDAWTRKNATVIGALSLNNEKRIESKALGLSSGMYTPWETCTPEWKHNHHGLPNMQICRQQERNAP